MIETYKEKLNQFLDGRQPKTLLILGSGLGSLADELTEKKVINYGELGFPCSTVSGHAGKLSAGKLGGQEVVCMQGRFHLYEGYHAELVKNIICAFASIGVQELIVTNAAGSLRSDMLPGSIMLIKDHINLSGQNPLVGFNDEKYGPRFPDMSNVYDSTRREKLCQLAASVDIKLCQGVYLMVLGPNFETAAEIRAFQILGADAVGMSTVPEVIAGVYAGLKIIGLSAITNLGTGLQKNAQNHVETLETASSTSKQIARLLKLYMEEK